MDHILMIKYYTQPEKVILPSRGDESMSFKHGLRCSLPRILAWLTRVLGSTTRRRLDMKGAVEEEHNK